MQLRIAAIMRHIESYDASLELQEYFEHSGLRRSDS
jgi:hypothetical protein